MAIEVIRIYRYPVKGLSAEAMERVMLSRGECLPQDRRRSCDARATASKPCGPWACSPT
jgi:uncharacterized protein YcbX